MPNEVIDRQLSLLQTWVATGLAFIVVFAVSMTGVMLWQASERGATAAKIEALTAETHTALCALRTDIKIRRNASIDFLKEHPNGIPGIDADLIQNNINSQGSTLRALSDLDCP